MAELHFDMFAYHFELMRRTFIDWNPSMYNGAPIVDIKRPYGNKSTFEDIAEIMGWPVDAQSENPLSTDTLRRCKEIHESMATAIQIVLCTNSFETGRYVKINPFKDTSWKLDKL